MKKIIYFMLFLCLFTETVNAQNSFPDSGKVGIGTRTPSALFNIKAPNITYDTASAGQFLKPYVQFTNYSNTVIFEARFSNNGVGNLAFGVNAGANMKKAAGGNIFIGNGAGGSTLGAANIYIGNNAGTHIVVGGNNTFVGFGSGAIGTSASNSTFFGSWSGYNSTGDANTFIGRYAGFNNTSGIWNTFTGDQSGYRNTTGNQNTFYGMLSGFNNTTGANNDFFGFAAGYLNVTGSNNYFSGRRSGNNNTSGSYNVFNGPYAAQFNTTGSNNLVIGYQAAGVTDNRPETLTTGSQNIVIGYQAGLPDGTLSNQLSIGNLIYGVGLNGTGATLSTGKIGIGTTAPDEKLTVYGNVHARGVKVDLNGPLADYVFESNYKLKPLAELNDYLKANHHLPEIPSAQQAEKEGLDLGKMNQLLLKKVEELTLYLIEKDKADKVKQKQIDQLKKSNALINKKLQALNAR